VTLEAKQATRGLLEVSLVGKEKRRTSGSGDNDTTHHKWVEVYRRDEVVEQTRDFPAGYAKSYDFTLKVPTAAEARGQNGAALREMSEQVGDGVAGLSH